MNSSSNQSVITYENLINNYDTTFLSVMLLLYIPLCFVSTLSTLSLLWAILYSKSLHNPTHVLIFNVGLSGLYYNVINLPIQISMFWSGREMFSCKLMNYLSVVFGFLEGYFYIAIAINRCVTVCLPQTVSKTLFTNRKTALYCLFLWGLSFAQNFPKSFVGENNDVFNDKQRCCSNKVVDYGKAYLPLLSLFGVTVLVSLCYIILFVYIRRYKTKVESQLGGNQMAGNAIKITKLTFLLYAFYVCLLIPAFTLSAVDPAKKSNPMYYNVMYFICMLDPLVTVGIYAGLNKPIRNIIRQRFFTLNTVADHTTNAVMWTQSNGMRTNNSENVGRRSTHEVVLY